MSKGYIGSKAIKYAYKNNKRVFFMNKGDTEGYSAFKPAVDQQFLYRKSGGDGYALYKGIKGKSIVWNQIINPTSFENSKTINGVHFTNNGDGSISVYTDAGGATANTQFQGSTTLSLGHKIVMCGCPAGGSVSTYYLTLGSLGDDIGNGFYSASVPSWSAGSISFPRITIKAGTTIATPIVFRPQLFDLTIAGLADEISSVADFKALYPALYYPYNPGIIKNNDADGIESVGFNQWDEEWEVGTINAQGENAPSTTEIRSKNYIPIISGVTQLFFTPRKLGDLFCYDADKNFISTATYTSSTIGVLCTLANNTAFVRFRTSAYGAVYLNNICVNLSDPDRNGTYEPYWKKDIQLKLSAIKVKSHNIWDEQWENCIWDEGNNGIKQAAPLGFGCKNKIIVEPDTDYYFRTATGRNFYILFYDANGDLISYTSGLSNRIAHSPVNAKYMTFYSYNSYGTTYLNDICINKSDASFNGHYDPYGVDGVFEINGLDGAGSVFDLAKAGMDGYVRVLGKVMNELDLGDLTWVAWSTFGYYAAVTDITSADVQNIICSKYPVNSGILSLPTNYPNCIAMQGPQGRIYITDTSVVDATAFKTAVTGVKLRYEMNTTIHYELAEPFFAGIMVDEDGTEKAIAPSAATTPSAPFRADIAYLED